MKATYLLPLIGLGALTLGYCAGSCSRSSSHPPPASSLEHQVLALAASHSPAPAAPKEPAKPEHPLFHFLRTYHGTLRSDIDPFSIVDRIRSARTSLLDDCKVVGGVLGQFGKKYFQRAKQEVTYCVDEAKEYLKEGGH